MNPDIGTIYFIGQYDPAGERRITNHVKIGLVRGATTVADRLKSLQTGNPNPLKPIDSVPTGLVSYLESLLHWKHASVRTPVGEWFSMADDDVQAAIRWCRGEAVQLLGHAEMVAKAAELGDRISEPNSVAPNDEIRHWFHLYRAYDQLEKTASGLLGRLRKSALALHEDGVDLSSVVTISMTNPRPRFDKESFVKDNPEIYRQYVAKVIQGRFLPKRGTEPVETPDGWDSNHDAALEAYGACLEVLEEKKRIPAGLFESQIAVQNALKAASGQALIAKAYLMNLCGLASGIDGMLGWKRSEGERFEEAAMRRDYGVVYSRYLLPAGAPQPRVSLRDRWGAESESEALDE